MDERPRVLFLSKGDASRAQIAEGFLRHLCGERFVPLSAGTESSNVHPLAVEVMSEAGVNISSQRPREIASLFKETIRYAVVVCDPACEKYPVFPFTPNLFKWCISDPEVANGGPEAKERVPSDSRSNKD
jgi:arsenate reductase